MRPSQFSELAKYEAVHNFVAEHLDMQFGDLRSMMMIPSCNFASATVLCNLVSGISVILYNPKSAISRGARFKELLELFYPWEHKEDIAEKINVLYDFIRNPLTHSLGVLNKNAKYQITIRKSLLEERQIEEMEQAEVRPVWLTEAIFSNDTKYSISIEGLYWGVFHLLKRLTMDSAQMQSAEKDLLAWK